MEKITYYKICYKTLSGRVVETNILFKRPTDALIYVQQKNNSETNWGIHYFTKEEAISMYSTYIEYAEQKKKDDRTK